MKKKYFKMGAIIIITLLFIGIFIYMGYCKNKTIEVEATVQKVYQGNIVVMDETGMEYQIVSDEEYRIGDKVFFVMKNPVTKNNITEGEVLQLETRSKSVQFYITDTLEEELEQGVETNSTVSSQGLNEGEAIVSNEETNGEEMVLSYFSDLESEVGSVHTNHITTSIKNGFVTIVDFLFYDGMIQGKKFSELSEVAKLKVLQIAFSIDSKIEEKFPDYKEEIQGTSSKVYTNLKTKILASYLEISTSVCENHSDICQSAKEGLSDLKTNFSLTWDFIKEISGVGLSKLKAWYEIWRESE